MGTVEQDLARYEREQDEREARDEELSREAEAIREHIESSVDELAEIVEGCLEGGTIEAKTIATILAIHIAEKDPLEYMKKMEHLVDEILEAVKPSIDRVVMVRSTINVANRKRDAELDRALMSAEDREAYHRDRDARGP
jgi:hypothetical protein